MKLQQITRLNRRSIYFLFTCSLLLSSCIGPARMDKWIAKHYGAVPAPVKKKSDLVTIQSNLPSMGSTISESRKKRSTLLPLIVYWKFTYGNTSNLNPQMALNTFTTTVNNQAARTLKQKLNGQTIELTVEKMPAAFEMNDEGHIIFVIYVISWEKIHLQPIDKELKVSYKVLNSDNSVAKTGTVSVPVTQEAKAVGLYQSVKKKTWQYLEEYDAGISVMSKKVVDQIAAQL